MLKRLVSIAAILMVLSLGAFVWPTLYRYDHYTADGTTVPIRMNRLTGKVEAWRTSWRAWH